MATAVAGANGAQLDALQLPNGVAANANTKLLIGKFSDCFADDN